MTYLDHNATSPLRPEAKAAMQRALEVGGNASAIHCAGRLARAVVDEARDEVAGLVNANPDDVVFTSGGSEANALALWGAVFSAEAPRIAGVSSVHAAGTAVPGKITRLVVSAIEHDSVLKAAAAIAERLGVEFAHIPVTTDGVLELDALERLLSEHRGRALVAVMAANNETGVIQPIAEAAALARRWEALLLIDAVQACGKIAVDCAALGADFLTLSAHKFGGPQGTGALVMKAGAPFTPQMPGGQEKGRRAGTENVTGIAGFGAAAEVARRDDVSQPCEWRDGFEAGLKSRFPDVVIFGEAAPRLANTSNFAIPGIGAETAVIALDLDGVMVSSGAACSSGKVQQSHVLKAMGVRPELASCGLRASFGWNSTSSDIDA
ncbi:MAG TPA: cysteine desulfurase family protein, partial [Rhizomicrobium sp.]|nr:cysteine desulfurase family protein [Rhizomicrobium sp.]